MTQIATIKGMPASWALARKILRAFKFPAMIIVLLLMGFYGYQYFFFVFHYTQVPFEFNATKEMILFGHVPMPSKAELFANPGLKESYAIFQRYVTDEQFRNDDLAALQAYDKVLIVIWVWCFYVAFFWIAMQWIPIYYTMRNFHDWKESFKIASLYLVMRFFNF